MLHYKTSYSLLFLYGLSLLLLDLIFLNFENFKKFFNLYQYVLIVTTIATKKPNKILIKALPDPGSMYPKAGLTINGDRIKIRKKFCINDNFLKFRINYLEV